MQEPRVWRAEAPGWARTMKMSGKVAIVTGAGGGGSGRAIARRLARDGAFVVVSDIDEQGGRETLVCCAQILIYC